MINDMRRLSLLINDSMILFATMLKEYCDNRHCENCPFASNYEDFRCRISTPAYWAVNVHKEIDFPNSASKESEDGSDPFDE